MKLWPIFMALFYLSSCSSTLDFHTPTQNFSSPEVVGKSLRVRMQATYSNSTKFELASLERNTIFDSSVDVSTERGSRKDNVLNGTGGIGLGNALEVTYRSYSDSPDLLGLKAQVYGRDGGEKKEGLKMSLLAGYGNAETDNDSLTVTRLDGSDQRTYNSTLDVETLELGAVIGYRINKTFLPYFAYNYRQSDAEGTLDSTLSTDVNIASKAKINSYQIGLQISSQKLYLLFEGGYARSEWANLTPEDDYSLGFAIGLISL